LIYSTHDIDWLWAGHPVGVAKWLLGKKWVMRSQLWQKDLFLKQCEQLLTFQQAQHITGIYLIGMQGPGRSLFPKAIRYTYADGLLKELITLLKHHKAHIGLHHHPKEPIARQINRFVELVNHAPQYVRGHYYAPLAVADSQWLAENGCRIDFGFGNRNLIGFVDTDNHASSLTQVHTIFSDNNLVPQQQTQEAFVALNNVLKLCYEKKLDAAILFHPENMAIYPHLFEAYALAISNIKHNKLTLFMG
jgi:hypothetical protein